MNLQQLIYLVLLVALFTTTILYGRLKYRVEALENLIASSPAVCFMCRQDQGKHIHRVTATPSHLHPNYHEYIDSRLVYLPDEFLR